MQTERRNAGDRAKTILHFVGIGGIGMSGIAEVFKNQGYPVTGSDLHESETTRRLVDLGIRIDIGHRAENVRGASVVVISSAVRPTNAEVVEAKNLHIPVVPRAEMLGELMRGKTGLSVAGSHGKTTTTSLLATILTHAGLDPTLVIGGKVDLLGGNAKLGQSAYVVAEADESDGSFLHLPTTYCAITNIDNDHLDFFGTTEAIDQAFVDFVARVPFYGLAMVCGEDAGVARCLGHFTKPYKTYGFSPDHDIYATDIKYLPLGSRFRVCSRPSKTSSHEELGYFEVEAPGQHNVLNSLAAIGLAHEIGISPEKIATALKSFRGVKRRFEVRWQDRDRRQVIIDDYGHHPTEIRATLDAARKYWSGRIITVFQPHRYSRTKNCAPEFPTAFRDSDVVFLTDIYAAGEDPIAGVDSPSLARAILSTSPGKIVKHVGNLENAKQEVLKILAPGDLVLCLGAGSITQLPDLLRP